MRISCSESRRRLGDHPQSTARFPRHHAGIYAQDQYKVNRSLTLNFGVRYELAKPYGSKHGTMYSFDPRTGSLVVPDKGVEKLNPLYPQNIDVITASAAGFPANLLETHHLFYPRVGFAYKLFGGEKSVIRGGYGIYGNAIHTALGAQGMTGGPFSGSATYNNAITNGAPLFSFPSPFLSSGSTSTQNVNGFNPSLKQPYTQQWNLTLEQQIATVGLRVAYLGTRSVHLLYRRNLNQPPAGIVPYSVSGGSIRCTTRSSTPIAEAPSPTMHLRVAADKKYGNNLTFSTGWNLAKDLTDTLDAGSPWSGQVIQDQFDRNVERTNNSTTRPHRIFAYSLYTLPFGKGQRFLSNARRPVQHILGGWELGAIMVIQSGQYFTPSFSGFDPSNTQTFGGRPDRIGNGNLDSGRSISRWFDTSAFAIPGCPADRPVCTNPAAVGRFGNSAQNILTGPRLIGLDATLMKAFDLGERFRLNLRLNVANALNHPSFNLPNANISSVGTVGTITSQSRGALGGQTGPREVDLGLRLEF